MPKSRIKKTAENSILDALTSKSTVVDGYRPSIVVVTRYFSCRDLDSARKCRSLTVIERFPNAAH